MSTPNHKKPGSLAAKVRKSTLFAMLLSGAAIFLAAAAAILFIRAQVETSSAQLGRDASADSVEGLTRLAEDSLLTLSRDRARICDEKLMAVSRTVEIVAQELTDVFAAPENYKPRTIPPPDPANDGQIVPQLLYAEGVDPEAVAQEAGLIGSRQSQMTAVLENNPNLESVQLGTRTGICVMTDRYSAVKPAHADGRDRPWYLAAQEAGGPTWTDVFEDSFGRGLAVTCAAPYYGPDGELLGVVGSSMLLETLDSIVEESFGADAGGRAFIVNENAYVIISGARAAVADGTDPLGNLLQSDSETLRDSAARITSGASGIDAVTLAGQDFFLAYSPLTVRPWSFAVLADSDTLLASATHSRQDIEAFTQNTLKDIHTYFFATLVALAVILLLTALVGMRVASALANSITKPLRQFTQNLSTVGTDTQLNDEDLRIQTGDELEQLAEAFIEMRVRLREYIENLSRVTAERERVGAELAIASQIQTSMLPRIFPPFPEREEFDLFASMQPAREVGGDFYDFFLLDEDRLAVVVADVSGKGVPASLFMVIAKTLLKNSAHMGKSPAEVFEQVNGLLCENNDTNMFVTAFMGYLTIKTGRFVYTNAGHNPPLVKRAGAGFASLPCSRSFVLGGMPGTSYRQEELALAPGDLLYLYTDGVTEAQNPQGELFTQHRLLEALDSGAGLPLRELFEAVRGQVDAFAAGEEQADDITMLALEYFGGGDTLTVEAEISRLGTVLGFVRKRLEKLGLPGRELRRIELAAEEVFANIAHYAYAPGRGECRVSVLPPARGEITLIFRDEGRPFDPLAEPEPDITAPAGDRDVGGLGIHLVKNTMDEVHYERVNGCNTLTMVKRQS